MGQQKQSQFSKSQEKRISAEGSPCAVRIQWSGVSGHAQQSGSQSDWHGKQHAVDHLACLLLWHPRQFYMARGPFANRRRTLSLWRRCLAASCASALPLFLWAETKLQSPNI